MPLFEKHNPLIEVTEENELILSAMQARGYIGTVREDEKWIGYYRVYSKRK